MNDNQHLVALFDKYIKKNDSGLINGYLRHLDGSSQPTNTINHETFYMETTQNELILAQKSYKFIILLDYSQYSALDLARIALEKLISKLHFEYDQLLSDISLKIHLTVILWHPIFKTNIFSILMFEKLIERMHLNVTLVDLILGKIVKIKEDLDESELEQVLESEKNDAMSFEYLVNILICLFKSNSTDIVNFIYITDGLFYSIDRSKQLELINTSGLAFSFILIGNSNGVSYSFGYTTDFVYMKFLASITRGHLATLNDYYEFETIVDNPLLLIFNRQLNDLNVIDDVIVQSQLSHSLSFNTTSSSTSSNSFNEQQNDDESHQIASQVTASLINLSSLSLAIDTLSNDSCKSSCLVARLSNCMSCKSSEGSSRVLKSVAHQRDQYLESKLLTRYEIKCDLSELLSIRSKEGFFVVKICNQNVCLNEHINKRLSTKKSLMSVYLVRYYSQTSAIIYKIIFNKKNHKRLYIELYLAWNFLNIKSNYQNSKLLQNLKSTINTIQYVDLNERRSWDLAQDLYKIPVDLQNKIKKLPLLKSSTKSIKLIKYEPNAVLICNTSLDGFINSWNNYLSCDFVERYMNIHTIDVLLNYIYKPSSQNGSFEPQYSLNEFFKVLNNWCDLILVENLIYIRYLNTSESRVSSSSPVSGTIPYNSFVLLRLNVKHLPFVSIRLSFNPNYSSCECDEVVNALRIKLETIFCRVLKPNCIKYELLEKILFDDEQQKSGFLNLMYQRKITWILSNGKFNVDSVRQQTIDLFVKMRLNEGFKCLFQTKKFLVLLNDCYHCEIDMSEGASIRKRNSLKSPTSVNTLFEIERSKQSRNCSILYAIHFSCDKIVTEISIEQIDGLYQSKNYFKDLNYEQIAKLIYLLDYEAFAINQTYFAFENYQQESLHLAKSGQIESNFNRILNELKLFRHETISYSFGISELIKYSSFVCVLYEDTPIKIASNESKPSLNSIFSENFDELVKENKINLNLNIENEEMFSFELKKLVKSRFETQNFTIDNIELSYFFKYARNNHQDQPQASTSSSSSAFSNTSSAVNIHTNAFKTLNSPNYTTSDSNANPYRLYLFVHGFLGSGHLVLFLFNCSLNVIRNSMLNANTRETLFIEKNLFKLSQKDEDSNKCQQLSKYLKSSNDNYEFLFYADLIEKFCSIAYLDSILILLCSFKKTKYFERNKLDFDDTEIIKQVIHQQQQPISQLDKSEVQKFLSLASKIKLVDIDITEYLRSTCNHLNMLEDGPNDKKVTHGHIDHNFHEKFDSLIDTYLSSLINFNDLFILDGKPTSTSSLDTVTSSPYVTQQYSKLVDSKIASPPQPQDTINSHLITIEYLFEINEIVKKFGKIQAKLNLLIKSQEFNGFNINCLYDVCSQDEIKMEEINERRSLLREDEQSYIEIKVYLRFNWYFFEDSLGNKLKSPFNQITIHTSSYSPPTQVASSGRINASLLISSASSLSPTSQVQSTNSLLIPTLTTNEKNELIHMIEPLVNTLKWYLNEEILQKLTHLRDLNEFYAYVRHIESGISFKYMNCKHLCKDVSFNSLLNVMKRNLLSSKTTEDCKLVPEFLELIEKLKGQFYQCKLQKLNDTNYFLSCVYTNNELTLTDELISLKRGFKIFVKINEREQLAPSRTPSPHKASSLNTISKAEKNIYVDLYFNFNNNYFVNTDLIDSLTKQFNDKLDILINSISLKLMLKEIDESRKWNDSLILNDDYAAQSGSKMNLVCECVWSQSFKLHRLNQKSAGLAKLKDFLVNLKIDDAPDDIYVFNHKALNEIYLIKIKEIESPPPAEDQNELTDELNFSRSLEDYESVPTLVTKTTPSCKSTCQTDMISRRQSYASVDESQRNIARAHNVSGGSTTGNVASSGISTGGNPDCIQLKLYGLHEPDEDFKQTLCKSLQTELDNCLLYKICYSIEKNTYKTSLNLQSFEEDLVFIKKLSELYIEDEIQLPQVFNLNMKLRENFSYYLRQILNSNFKTIEFATSGATVFSHAPLSESLNKKQTSLSSSSSTTSSTDLPPPPPPSPLLPSNFTQTTQIVLTQNYSFSFLCPQPSPGPLNELNEADCTLITRLFNLRIGFLSKNSFSIALIECYYLTNGSSQLITSRLVKASDAQSSNGQTIQINVNNGCQATRPAPTLYFRYYIRGENDVELIKGNLKAALNEALLLVVSNYLTKIDVDLYLKYFEANHESQKATELDYKAHGEIINHLNDINDLDLKFDYNRLLSCILLVKSNEFDANYELDEKDSLVRKTYLRLIYDWLRILFCFQRTNLSNSSNSSLSTSLSGVVSLSRLNSTSNQSLHLSNSIQLTHRKEFAYFTKYNLISFIRDYEHYLRDNLKSQVQKNFYSFVDGNFIEVNHIKNDSSDLLLINVNDSQYKDDFDGLQKIDFSNIEDHLNQKLNIICVLNVDFTLPSSTKTISNVPSFNNVTNLAKTPKQFGQNMSSLSRIEDSNLRRLYCLLIVDSKKKSLISYSFITESKHYDLVKSYLDQVADTIYYRTNLINNTIVYKLGGLIGDAISDAKNIKNLFTYDQNNEGKSRVGVPAVTGECFTIKAQSPTVHRQFIFPLTSSQNTQSQSAPSPSTPFRSCLLTHTHIKCYDQIINQVNQQIAMTQPNQLTQLTSNESNVSLLTLMYTYSTNNYAQKRRSSLQKSCASTSSIYGVGLNYQLLEKSQIYRHPQKIFELASTLVTYNSPPAAHSSSILSTTVATAASPQFQSQSTTNKIQLSVAEFYKIQVVPVLNVYRYCVTPSFFFKHWSDVMVTEKMLTTLCAASTLSSGKSSTNYTNSQLDDWYKRMRLHLLNDFSKYFETKGFDRLREDRKLSGEAITINSQSGIPIDNASVHFIKWIQNDGFLYMTLNFEEIYLVAKFGFSTRYRSASRAFFNEITRFLTNDFNIHALSYDFHLSVLSRILQSPSQQGILVQQTLLKCLDEFVEYFNETRSVDSMNRVLKCLYERQDCSMIPHKVGLIFDYILNIKQKQADIQFILINLSMQSNLAIYCVLTNQQSSEFSKYFLLKIDTSSRTHALDSHVGIPIRLIGYFLCISKLNSLKLSKDMFDNDFNLIDQTVENSISDYKRQIFWDNLSLMNDQQACNLATYLMQNNELEYILENSFKINACKLDGKLDGMLKKCYYIRDLILNHFNQVFNKNNIFLSLLTVDFCILLVTSSLMYGINNDEDSLDSFVLLKFNHANKTCELLQVNRLQKQDQKLHNLENLQFIINTLVYLLWKSLNKS